MVRGARKDPIAADHLFERFVKPPVVGVGGGESLLRFRDAIAQPVEIDGK